MGGAGSGVMRAVAHRVDAADTRRWVGGGNDPDDVRFYRCVTCGAPSPQGLCKGCGGEGSGAVRQRSPSGTRKDALARDAAARREDELIFTRAEWRRILYGPGVWNCTCAECEAGRKRPNRRQRFGRRA